MKVKGRIGLENLEPYPNPYYHHPNNQASLIIVFEPFFHPARSLFRGALLFISQKFIIENMKEKKERHVFQLFSLVSLIPLKTNV